MPLPAEQVTFRLAEDNNYGREGQLVTLALTPSDVHDPTELPTFLAGYSNGKWRADEVSKTIPGHAEDKYRSFGEDDTFLRVNVRTSQQGSVNEVSPTSGLTPYSMNHKAIGSVIPPLTERNSSYRLRQVSARLCHTAISREREFEVWDMLRTAGNWNANNIVTLASGYEWNGGANSDPLLDVERRILASAQEVTDIWINQEAAFALLRHDKVKSHLLMHNGDRGTGNDLRRVQDAKTQVVDFMIPGFPPFHVVGAKAKATSAGSVDAIFGADMVLTTGVAGIPMDGMETATTYTFRDPLSAGVGYRVREYHDPSRGTEGSTVIVVHCTDVPVLTGPNCGGLVKDILQ